MCRMTQERTPSSNARPLDSFFSNLFQECAPSIQVEDVQLIADQHRGFCSTKQSPCSSHDKSASSHASIFDDRWDSTSSCQRDVALSSPVSSRLRWKSQEDVMDIISWTTSSSSLPPEKPRRTQDSLALLKNVIKGSSLDQTMHKLPLSSPRVSTRKLPKALQGLPYSSDCGMGKPLL